MAIHVTPENVRLLAAGAGLRIPDEHVDLVVRQLQLLHSGLEAAPQELLREMEPAYNLPLPLE